MRHRAGTRKWLIGWTAAGVAVAGIAAAGIANAATSNGTTPTTTASGSSSSTKAVRAKALLQIERKLAHNATHGEIVLDTKKGLRTVDFQRGTVSNAATDGFTVTDKGGTVENWASAPNTKVRQRSGHGNKPSSGQIVNGEAVVVVGLNDGGTLTARLVVVLPAGQPTVQPTT